MIIVSGPIGVHGIAIMSVREGLEFGTQMITDSAALHPLVAEMIKVCPDLHVLRDPTRGGLGTSLNEIARTAGVGVQLVERSIPVPPDVANACALLGLDPLYVANEGKLVAFVPRDDADAVLAAMRAHPLGAGAAIIGEASPTTPAWWSPRPPSAAPGWSTCRWGSSCRASAEPAVAVRMCGCANGWWLTRFNLCAYGG